jgi:hypothetical protein
MALQVQAPVGAEGVDVAIGAEAPTLSVLTCSWNVGNALPPTGDGLAPWIPLGGKKADGSGFYDIICCGMQECEYKAGDAAQASHSDDDSEEDDERGAAAAGGGGGGGGAAAAAPAPAPAPAPVTDRRASGQSRKGSVAFANPHFHFLKQVQTHLGADYFVVGWTELVEMRLIVLAHTKHDGNVTGVEVAHSACGLGGVYGNKGGLVCKFSVYNTSLCFTSCHLAAHEKEKFMLRRNSDVAEVMEEALVGNKKLDIASQFDHSFFMGDLNYRTDLAIGDAEEGAAKKKAADGGKKDEKAHFQKSRERVLKLVEEKNYAKLLQHDQLLQQQRLGKVFAGWTDLVPDFRPSFKVKRASVKEQYNEKRTPSYCDRILHRSLPSAAADLTNSFFTSVPDLTTSDHKPVHAAFEVKTGRGFTPAFDNETCPEIRVTNLKASNCKAMDPLGGSDPYVVFASAPDGLLRDARSAKVSPKTRVISSTLNPEWKDAQVPNLLVGSSSVQQLDTAHLVLAVIDYDTTSADDPMGYAIIPLSKLSRADGPVAFSEELNFHGQLEAGTITGTLEMLWPKDGQRPAGSVVGKPPANGCCTVM